jgi:hypothetical protein
VVENLWRREERFMMITNSINHRINKHGASANILRRLWHELKRIASTFCEIYILGRNRKDYKVAEVIIFKDLKRNQG